MRCAHFVCRAMIVGLHYVTTLLPLRIPHDHRLVEYFRTIRSISKHFSLAFSIPSLPVPHHTLPIISQVIPTIPVPLLPLQSPSSMDRRSYSAPTFCNPDHEVRSQTQNHHASWLDNFLLISGCPTFLLRSSAHQPSTRDPPAERHAQPTTINTTLSLSTPTPPPLMPHDTTTFLFRNSSMIRRPIHRDPNALPNPCTRIPRNGSSNPMLQDRFDLILSENVPYEFLCAALSESDGSAKVRLTYPFLPDLLRCQSERSMTMSVMTPLRGIFVSMSSLLRNLSMDSDKSGERHSLR